MRRTLIAGNWKMNKDVSGSVELVKAMLNSLKNEDFDNTDVLVCPPFTSLFAVSETLKGSKIKIGAQNMHYKDEGAYTGEISSSMLKSAGCSYVILGHSERRQYFHETDHLINLKVKKALEAGIIPIVCVGETLEQREEGIHEKVVDEQITFCLKEIAKDEIKNVVIAYEPVWAIGTGKTATPEQANTMHKKIRQAVENLFDSDISSKIIILYGGSMNDKNAAELLGMEDIDGGLIGGASLKADAFSTIIRSSKK